MAQEEVLARIEQMEQEGYFNDFIDGGVSFLNCSIKWNDSDEESSNRTICLVDSENYINDYNVDELLSKYGYCDDDIFYYATSIEELKELAYSKNFSDFCLTEINPE